MKKPEIDPSAFIAPGAQVVGDVTLGSLASVWYNAVLRGDLAHIEVGVCTNVQDNCTLHCDAGVPLVLGRQVTVGHNAVLHSCKVGDGSLIGMGAVLLGGVQIGRGCLVAAGAVLTPRTVIPDGCMVMGFPARVKRRLTGEEQRAILENAAEYLRLAEVFRAEN